MKTTSVGSIDEKIRALQELQAERYKRKNAKIAAVLKDPNATASDIERAFRNSWLHWIAELGVEAIERRMRGWGGAVEPTPSPIAEARTESATPSFPESNSSSSHPPAPRSVSPPAPLAPAPSAGGGLCITFINQGAPIFYAYEPNGTITLTDHSGQPIRANGKMFQARLDRGESADEVAIALFHQSRGEKHDHFDGPILYRDTPVY